MKQLIAELGLILMLVLAQGSCGAAGSEYAMVGQIIEVNYEQNFVTIVSADGNGWEWQGIEDWQEGDLVTIIMNDNGTEEIFDDVIISMRYDGWIE